ncbi:hypothetical protein [Streptomyces sp. NPDC059071]|uniref:hypothetical protein n=1 Tax=unclassified Streptomyces TaxID=2593676 RepID=UPI00362708E4
MRTRISRGLAAALAVSALSLTAACGGGAKDDTKKDGADKPAAGATTSAAPTSEAPATPLTAAQMKAAALELKDLPSGWKASTAEDDDTVYKADKPECAAIADLMSGKIDGGTEGAEVGFSKGNNDSEVDEAIATFPGTGAADFTKKIGTALESCTGFTTEVEGSKWKLTLTKLPAPQGVEEAYAFGVAIEVAPGMKIEPNVIVARQGTGVLRFLHLADAAGKKDFDSLSKLATDKFVTAAKG